MSKTDQFGQLVQRGGLLASAQQTKLFGEPTRELPDGGDGLRALHSAPERLCCFGKTTFTAKRCSVCEGRLELAQLKRSLLVERPRQDEHREEDRGGDDEGRRSQQGDGPAPPPLLPALGQAAIGNAAQRQIVELAAQVVCQERGGVIAAGGLWREAFLHDIRQADGHLMVAALPPLCGGGVLGGPGPGERLAEQEAQRVEVGTGIDRLADRVSQAGRVKCGAVLGGHPAGCAPESVGNSLARADRPSSQVEVQKHREAVGRDQYIRGLHVEVDQTVRMGARESASARHAAIQQPACT